MELLVVFGIAVLVAGILAYANEKDLNNQDIFTQSYNPTQNNIINTQNDDSDIYYNDSEDNEIFDFMEFDFMDSSSDEITDPSYCSLSQNIYHDSCMGDDWNWSSSSWDD